MKTYKTGGINIKKSTKVCIKIALSIVGISIFLFLFFGSATKVREENQKDYDKAMELMESGDYIQAVKILKPLQGWKDGTEQYIKAKIGEAEQLVYIALDNEDYEYVLEHLSSIQDDNDREQVEQKAHYGYAVDEYGRLNYGNALSHFICCGDYLDSEQYKLEILNIITPALLERIYQTAINEYNDGNLETALEYFNVSSRFNYKDSEKYIEEISK